MSTKQIFHVDEKATAVVGLMAYFGIMLFTISCTVVLQKFNVITGK